MSREAVVRYRGYLLLPQTNQSWLVRPERSPMQLLPFRTPTCSLADVKALLDGDCLKNDQKSGWPDIRPPPVEVWDHQAVETE